MSWVFAILVVLAMGGVALVAAGRGGPMTDDEGSDRPDLDVSATGPVSADELRRVRFSLAFRGYRMAEVDALLDRLAQEREAVEAEAGWQPAVPHDDGSADDPTDDPTSGPIDGPFDGDHRSG